MPGPPSSLKQLCYTAVKKMPGLLSAEKLLSLPVKVVLELMANDYWCGRKIVDYVKKHKSTCVRFFSK
jgi:hypothetical protein